MEVVSDEETTVQEQIFHNYVREIIIHFLFFFGLHLLSYCIISHFKKRARDEDLATDADEAIVYRFSLWLCSFSLAVSIAAALLLPLSIASNEVLLLYPNSYYVKWLNAELIHGLWNLIFLFSNGSLFLLLPFAYFFIESEGFLPHHRGIRARVYEAAVLLLLLSFIVMGLTVTLSALMDRSQATIDLLFNIWDYYLPFLYSCVSFCGVLMLLLCTPMGLAHLFTVVGDLLVKPYFLRDLDDDLSVAHFELADLQRKLAACSIVSSPNGSAHAPLTNKLAAGLQSGAVPLVYVDDLRKRIKNVKDDIARIEKHKKLGPIRRNLLYPLSLLVLLVLTTVTVLMVASNTLQLLVGIKALPLSTQEHFALGISSLSMLGSVGASLEIVIIAYLMVTTIVGLYTLPCIRTLRPRKLDTPITHIIIDCGLVLILSSALPLLARTLGITNFDLLGDFGRIKWLGNFYIIFAYNVLFAVLSGLCLVNKFTAKVRKELLSRLQILMSAIRHADQSKLMNTTITSTSKEE